MRVPMIKNKKINNPAGGPRGFTRFDWSGYNVPCCKPFDPLYTVIIL